jgi:phage minor structural protein
MPHLYILDKQYRAVGILSNELDDACPFYEDRRTERLEHALLTFECTIPANHETASLLTTEGFLIYPNDEGEFDLFKIKEITDTNANNEYRKKIVCENAAVSDLLGKIVRPVTLNSQTIEQIMLYILQGTGWELGRVDYAGAYDFKFEKYTRSLAALHQVLDTFGAELKFRVEFNKLNVTGRFIDVLELRGTNDGRMFEYGRDLAEVEKIEDTRDLVTALIGVGSDNLTFANYSPPADPKYEKFNDWVGSIEALERWSEDGEHIFDIYEDESTNAVELYNNTLKQLEIQSKPKLTYNVKFSYLDEPVSLGSTYRIKDTTYQPDLFLEARCIERTTSLTDPTNDEVVFGEFRPLVFQPINPDLSAIRQNVKSIVGGHVIVYGPTQDDTKGFYAQSDESITIEVTNDVHLGYVSIFTAEEITSGIVELRDENNNVIESKSFDATTLIPQPDSVYEYILKLNFVLSSTIGTYKLWGSFDGATFVRLPDEISFPYDSGEIRITGTSDVDGYYWHFFKLQVAGSGVLGGASQTITVGDLSNNFSTFRSLNTDGEATFVVDKDQVSIGVANIGQVVSESIVNYSSDDFTFYVNANTGDDENDGLTSATAFASMARALQSVPRMCDGNVTINIESDINEDINILGFIGLNAISIYGGSKIGSTYTHYTIIGDIAFDSTTKRVNFFYGRYFPRTQKTGSSGATNFGAKSQYVYFRECYISGRVPGTSSYNTNAVAWNDNGYIHLSHCYLQDWGTNAIRAASHGRIHLEACAGTTANAAGRVGEATIGGQITFVNGTNLLTNATTPGYPQSGSSVTTGRIIASVGGLINGSTTAIDANGGGGTGTTPPSTTPTTITYSSNNSGRSYRYTKYIGWRSELDVREGDYGYGAHKGLWFFSGVGSTPPWIGKTIKEIWVYVIRLNEGGGAGTVRFKTHNYLNQPVGEPTIGTAYVPASFKFGEKKWVRLDGNSTIKSAFAANTAKGIAIDGGAYAIFSIAANLKVIYQ